MPTSALVMAAVLATACNVDSELQSNNDERAEILDTESELARAQYQANLEFARSYQPTCISQDASHQRPRVLVTGFGRFQSTSENATGQAVSELLPNLEYPLTVAPPRGTIDDPAAQTRVAMDIVELFETGEVELCAMVLPVFWGLAAALILEEVESFDPDFVVMNGVASARQNLSFELGAVNQVSGLKDGSQNLAPLEAGSPLVPEASDDEFARANLLSWQRVRDAAEAAVIESADTLSEGSPLSLTLPGVSLAAFPRLSNTYLCNNVTYTVGYAMDHQGEPMQLMQSSHLQPDGTPDFIGMELGEDHTMTPRVFLHWPGAIAGPQLAAGRSILLAVIDAQLSALWQPGHELPSRGDNAIAD